MVRFVPDLPADLWCVQLKQRGSLGWGVIVQGRVRAIVVHVSNQSASHWPFRDTVHAPNSTEGEMKKRDVWGEMELNLEYAKIGHCQR